MAVVKKYRGSIEKVVADYVRERVSGRADIDARRVFLIDTCADDRLAAIARDILRETAGSARSWRPRPAAPSSATPARTPWASSS